MIDNYNREIKYLRVSLTELCNLRCRYCMPEDGVCKKSHEDMLTQEETINVIKVAAELGITKIRLTGGEPLVKKNIVEIVSKIRNISSIEEICLTTNGVLLDKYVKDLKKVGLDRINISLDTLNAEKYRYITRIGKIEDTFKGIEASLNEGFEKIKINTVLIGGFNDDEIIDFAKLTLEKPLDVRFIELMPMYDSGDFNDNAFIACEEARKKIEKYFNNGFTENEKKFNKVDTKKGTVADLYHIDGAKGNVGFISPVHNHFCSECNRIRLTADGHIKPCLHSNQEISVKGLSESEIKEKFKEAILAKPRCHDELSYQSRSKAERNMNQIGG